MQSVEHDVQPVKSLMPSAKQEIQRLGPLA
jgi:hypothetical protein